MKTLNCCFYTSVFMGVCLATVTSVMGQNSGPSTPPISIPAQISWGLDYIKHRWGDPIRAMANEAQFHWYDRGGWLPTGVSLAVNNTGKPERVLGPGEGGTVNFHFPNYVGSKSELISMIRNAMAQFESRNARPAF